MTPRKLFFDVIPRFETLKEKFRSKPITLLLLLHLLQYEIKPFVYLHSFDNLQIGNAFDVGMNGFVEILFGDHDAFFE